MKVRDLDKDILFETTFAIINKSLSSHIDKLESDAKEVNLNIVNLMVKKAETMLSELNALVKTRTIVGIDEKLGKITKTLLTLKDRFIKLLKAWEDNEFEKETMRAASTILHDLIAKITDSTDTAEEKIQVQLKKIANGEIGSGEFKTKSNARHRRVPQGAAQDIKTKKGFVAKQD